MLCCTLPRRYLNAEIDMFLYQEIISTVLSDARLKIGEKSAVYIVLLMQ